MQSRCLNCDSFDFGISPMAPQSCSSFNPVNPDSDKIETEPASQSPWKEDQEILTTGLAIHFCASPNKETRIMQKALHVRTTVLPGGKVEFASPELEAGQTVDVVVLHESTAKGRSIMEILNSGPEQRLFKTAKEVDDYIAEERASWER